MFVAIVEAITILLVAFVLGIGIGINIQPKKVFSFRTLILFSILLTHLLVISYFCIGVSFDPSYVNPRHFSFFHVIVCLVASLSFVLTFKSAIHPVKH